MKPMTLNPIVEHNARSPIASWSLGEGKTVYDFGQNIAGVVRVGLPETMTAGQTIRISHAEELDEDGSLFTAPLRQAKATDTYIASDDCITTGNLCTRYLMDVLLSLIHI